MPVEVEELNVDGDFRGFVIQGLQKSAKRALRALGDLYLPLSLYMMFSVDSTR
ncbi:hypothetical protein [[Eubacterium] cellulosolvens]